MQPAGRAHTGKVVVSESNRRWCSDGVEFCCDNGEKLRITFVLDCCKCEALHRAAGSDGFDSDTVQDVMLGVVECRCGQPLPPSPSGGGKTMAWPIERMKPGGSPDCWAWIRKENWHAVRRMNTAGQHKNDICLEKYRKLREGDEA